MRYSDPQALGPATPRVVAAALLLILAMSGITGERILALESDAAADFVVAQDGSGTHDTIADAVAEATDGQSILVRNGTYAESVDITEDITLFGESREGVIIEFGAGCELRGEGLDQEQTCPPDVPLLSRAFFLPPGPYALQLVDSSATLHDLTIGHHSRGFGLYVSGGSPRIERTTFAHNDAPESDRGTAWVMLRGGTSATISDSDFGLGLFEVEEASPVTIERSTTGALLTSAPDDEPIVIRDNVVGGIIWADGLHIIEGNEITLPTPDPFESSGIFIGSGSGWIVRGNTVRNSVSSTGAIDVGDQAGAGVIVDNVVEGSRIGILSSSRAVVEIVGNHVKDGETGIRALSSPVEVADNTVEGMTGNGIMLGHIASLSGNVACGNGTDLFVSRMAVVDDDGTNEFCVVTDHREQ